VAPPNSNKPLAFNPIGRCPQFVVSPEIAGPAAEKERADAAQVASLAKYTVPAPIHSGLDGGMNRVFLAQVGGSIPPARVPPPGMPQQPPPVMTADEGGAQPSLANRLFGGLFGSKSASTQVAATEAATQERGAEPSAKSKSAAHVEHATVAHAEHAPVAVAARSRPSEKASEKSVEAHNAEPRRPAPVPQETASIRPKTAPQQEANAAPPASSGSAMKGAQPAVPAGSFDSRWGGLQ
jgi:hypothetical protein